VHELGDMPVAELWDWVDYFAVEPRPDVVHQIAVLTAVVYNLGQGWAKHPQPKSPSDFLPRGSLDNEQPEGVQAVTAMHQLAAMMGAKLEVGSGSQPGD
jgi:hypothetical protein